MRWLIGLLFLINSFQLVIGTEYLFNFNITLTCKRKELPRYNFKMQFFDQDVTVANGDDAITELYSQNERPGRVEVLASGKLDGDEWLSKFFNVKMVLSHTCTVRREEVRADVQLRPLFPIAIMHDPKKVRYTYTADINITEMKGEHAIKGDMEYSIDR